MTSWSSVPGRSDVSTCAWARLVGGAVFLVELNRQRLDMSAAVVKPDAAICGGEVDRSRRCSN